jgi:trans-2-enoyl-CoA reductase
VKVIEYAKFGAPFDVCKCIEVDDPVSPQANEIFVAVEASAINPADLLMIRGEYPCPNTLPARQGIEEVGRIIAVDSDVEDYIMSDRVLLLGRGNWVEKVVCSADQVVRIPEYIDLLQAAQMKANPPSAHFMLHDYVGLEEGNWVTQNAANSAVGQHVIRLTKKMGIKTINIVRWAASISILKAIGADFVFVDGDAYVLLAIDAAGGKPCEHLADCLCDGGMVVNYGSLDGKPCMITPTHTIVRQISLTGFWLLTACRASRKKKLEIFILKCLIYLFLVYCIRPLK